MRIETAVIEIINTCNLRCKHCYGQFEKPVVLQPDKFELYLRQLYNYGTTRLTITGGEPFLLGDNLWNYIQVARRIGLPFIAVTTNGTVPLNNIEKIIESVDLLQISVDGNQKIHDEIRGDGTYNKTTEFICKVSAICNNKVGVMMSLHKMNFSQLQFVHDFARHNNISFAVEIVTPCGRGAGIDVLDNSQMLFVRDYLRTNGISCNDPITFCDKNSFKLFNRHLLAGCVAGVSALCIDSYGTVFPCVRLRIPMGNMADGIETIFRSKLYENLNDRRLLKGRCAKCLFLYSCGGCRARAFSLYNDYLAEDKYCITYIEKRENENNS